jgi:hypothetical protein
MKREERKQVKIWLTPSCVENIWKDINDSYPRYKKGLMSEHVENLINRGLSWDKHTHTNTKSAENKIMSDNAYVVPEEMLRLKGAIMNFINEKYGFFPGSLTEDQLREAIRCIIKNAKDNRTQNNYINQLIDYRLIKSYIEHKHRLYSFEVQMYIGTKVQDGITPLQGDLR